jgi:two-component system chemotaxis response regulator CheY
MSIADRLHVMVVDDMSTSRGLLTQGLDSLGIKNYSAVGDGVEAFNRLAIRPVHLVISDYNMPRLDGLGLLDELRRHPLTQKIAFILVTGTPSADVVQKGTALRVNYILKKPFTVPQLRGSIEKVVGAL